MSEGTACDVYQVELPEVRIGGGAAPSTVKRVHYGGHVVDEQGRPIPHVKLSLMYDKNHMLYGAGNLLTDAEGKFMRTLPPGADNVNIRLTAQDYIGYQFEQSDTPVSVEALKAGTAIITMKRGQSVPGTIVDAATGKPVVNALVMAATSYSSSTGEIIEDYTSPRTDFVGQFTATGIPPGPRQLRIIADGYSPQVVHTDVKSGMPPLQIQLLSGLTYSGQVLDVAGKPLADVRMHAEDWSINEQERVPLPRSTVTDATGHFTMTDLPREGTIAIFLGKKKFASMSATWSATGSNSATIGLVPAPVVTGSVVDDATGQPVTDFTAYPGWYSGNEPSTLDFSKPKPVHNETGKFSVPITNFISPVVNPTPMAVRIVAEGYAPAFSAPVPLDGKPHPVTIRLHAAAPLNGTLRDADGKPVSGTKVMLVDSKNVAVVHDLRLDDNLLNTPKDSVATDDDGGFKLPAGNLPAQFFALDANGYALIPVKSAEQPLTARLTPWATVEGTLTQNGAPQNGVTLWLEPMAEPDPRVRFELVATTDSMGHFRFEHVPAIDVRLLRVSDGYTPLTQTIHPEPGKSITIPLPSTATSQTGTGPATRSAHTGG